MSVLLDGLVKRVSSLVAKCRLFPEYLGRIVLKGAFVPDHVIQLPEAVLVHVDSKVQTAKKPVQMDGTEQTAHRGATA